MLKMTIEDARLQMMHPAGVINLNAGTCSPVSRPVFQSLVQHLTRQSEDPADYIWNAVIPQIEEGRKSLASFLTCPAENLLLVTNASYGINAIVQTFPWQAGDEILTTDQEYHHYQTLFQKIIAEKQVALVKVKLPLDEKGITAADICALFEQKRTSRTRALFFSHVTSPTGFCLPAAELCAFARGHGILTIVDGAHAPGHVPLSIETVDPDFYVANVHKWMMNPAGCAFVYAAAPVRFQFKPLLCMSGYNAVANHETRSTVYGTSAWSFAHEYQGTRNLTSLAVLNDTLTFFKGIGLPAIQSAWQENRARLVDILTAQKMTIVSPDSEGLHSCMVACRLPINRSIDSFQARKYFRERHQMELAFPSLEDGTSLLRVSAAWFNTKEQLAALAVVLDGFDWTQF